MIADPVLTHRADYWTWVELHAVPAMRDKLIRLRDHWHEVNVKHFDGAMVLPYITLTTPSKPSIYGQCCPVSSWGSRLEIKLRPSLVDGTHPHVSGDSEGCWRFLLDVLTHEAIHQWQMEITGSVEDSYHGHGPTFTAKANAIGATLGLPEVVVKNRGGTRVPKAAQWPHCARPVEYYLDAYHPDVPTVRDTVPCQHCDGTGQVAAGPRSTVDTVSRETLHRKASTTTPEELLP